MGDIMSLKTKSVFRSRSIDKQVSDQVLHRDDLWRNSDRLISLAEHDVSKFQQHTDATLFKACDHLRQGDETIRGHCKVFRVCLLISMLLDEIEFVVVWLRHVDAGPRAPIWAK